MSPPSHSKPEAAPPRLWIFCPVYYDVESFTQLRRKLLEALKGGESSSDPRFVVIDDTAGVDPEMGSLEALADVQVVRPPFNLGHQRALVYGLRNLAQGMGEDDAVVTMDSDGEDQPADVSRLLAELDKDRGFGRIVLAQRTKRRESVPFKLLYACFKLFFYFLTGTVIHTGNFATYRGRLARSMLFHPHFDLSYGASLLSINLPTSYVPCERGRRYAGRSRMGYSRLIMHGIRMLMPFLDRIAIRSLIAFGAIFVLGLVLSVTVVCVRVFTTLAIPGWATYTLLLILILSFVALGNFLVLFAVFSQSHGVSLSQLDRDPRGSS